MRENFVDESAQGAIGQNRAKGVRLETGFAGRTLAITGLEGEEEAGFAEGVQAFCDCVRVAEVAVA